MVNSDQGEGELFGTLDPEAGSTTSVVKRSRFSVEQIVAVLRQAASAVPVCKVDIREQTFYRWKKRYGSLQPDEGRELKQMQDEILRRYFRPQRSRRC